MIGLSRFQIGLLLVTLVALRLGIGAHFLWEGSTKIRSGNFSAEGFIQNGKGPVAEFMQDKMISDREGMYRLCYEEPKKAGERGKIDPDLTLFIWEDYKNKVARECRFGDPKRVDELKQNRVLLKTEIESLRQTQNDPERLKEAIAKYESDLKTILQLRAQVEKSNEIFETRKEELLDFLDENHDDILNYFEGASRLVGFKQDGPKHHLAAMNVTSLRGQVDQIKYDRYKQAAPWMEEMESAWNGYERDINDLILEEDRDKYQMSIFKPHESSQLIDIVNQFVPYFDLTVGLLLFFGLFTRVAAIAGAGFLATICLMQWPLHPASVSTFYQFVEMAGMLVLASAAAGRFAGLDYFIYSATNKKKDFQEDQS